jgi:hypothetical protein
MGSSFRTRAFAGRHRQPISGNLGMSISDGLEPNIPAQDRIAKKRQNCRHDRDTTGKKMIRR